MWWLIIVIGIVAGFVWGIRTEYGDFLTGILGAIAGCLTSLLILLILYCCSFCFLDGISYSSPPENIVSLQDSNTIEGSFTFGNGYIDEELTYTFMFGNEEDGFRIKQVKAADCIIKYTDGQPYALQGYYYFNGFGRFMWGTDGIKSDEYIIFIPEDAVTIEFSIDLQ